MTRCLIIEVLDNKEYGAGNWADFENMIRPYNYENYDYVRAARTVEELVNESSQMNHCVRNYIPKIAAHQSAVFFLLEKQEERKITGYC